jgi:hypothetical protein
LRQQLVVAAIALAATTCAAGGRHVDGEGPVAWLADPAGGVVVSADRPADGDGITFGEMDLCVESDEPAVIRSVEPIETVGGPVESKVFLRYSPPGDVIISAPGFPTQGLAGTMLEAEGATVDVQCGENGWSPIEEPRNELLVALRPETDRGGGWVGLAATYEYRGDVYSLEMRSLIGVCDVGVVAGCQEMLEGSSQAQAWGFESTPP